MTLSILLALLAGLNLGALIGRWASIGHIDWTDAPMPVSAALLCFVIATTT